jgi:hypothetical protein
MINNMKNKANSAVFSVIAIALVIAASGATQAYAVDNGGDDSQSNSQVTVSNTTSTVSNGGDDSSNASVSTSVSNGGDDVTTNTTGTGTSNGGDDSSNTAGAVLNGGDDVSGNGNPNTPGSTGTVTNGDDDTANSSGGNNNGGNNNGGSDNGGSTRSGSRGGSTNFTTGSVVTTLSGSCPLISSEMLKAGISNNAGEVAKLQAFLKNVEKLNVDVTGTYDAKTVAAVHAFQKKYADTVLLPWGGTKSSGIAYITTIKKINQISCAAPLSLTQDELNIINAFRAEVLARKNTVNSSVVVASGSSTSSNSSTTDATGTSTDENSNVANPVRTSLAARFWNFIVNLFR